LSKHHFVPQLILRRFRSTSKEFFYFNIEKPDDLIVNRNTRSVFYQRGLNTLSNKSESREQQFAARLETPFNQLLDQIEQVLFSKSVLDLSDDDRALIASFFYYQYRRRPSIVDELMSDPRRIELDQAEVDALKFTSKALLSDDQNDRDYLHDLRAVLLVHMNPEVVKDIIKTGVCFVRNSTDQPFIVGSRPICHVAFKANDTLVRERYLVERFVFPVSARWSILIGPVELDRRVLEITNNSEVRLINKKIALQSTMIGGPRRSDIEVLAKAMLASERLGDGKESPAPK